ncbi:hypothetical protein K432DRAFT_291670 [Lepidopterella palustris CBS 459.81]|uniref:DUF7704 domain-containing protein n=1 Tax=Lepidopterella palustris CBS 459.81 TaxID=1314670 RepID=A0A8E2EGK2_9PEZI|nr:hypothetical protein K432DRAFT_291670 [Lepidopterella palustris CBS 459.81]
MAFRLPRVPRIIFTILEPTSLIAGFLFPVLSPSVFVSSQTSAVPPHNLHLTEHVLALQLGNAYLLLALLGLFILNTTRELATVHAYLLALWIADIGHVAVTMWGLGWAGTLAVADWNAVTWGNIGVTGFLFAVRSCYFLGMFGEDIPLTRFVSHPKVL